MKYLLLISLLITNNLYADTWVRVDYKGAESSFCNKNKNITVNEYIKKNLTNALGTCIYEKKMKRLKCHSKFNPSFISYQYLYKSKVLCEEHEKQGAPLNQEVYEVLKNYPWVKDISKYKKGCINLAKDDDYRAISAKYCKVSLEKMNNSIALNCPKSGFSSERVLLYKTKEQCENKK
jgi:hypothetical protein